MVNNLTLTTPSVAVERGDEKARLAAKRTRRDTGRMAGSAELQISTAAKNVSIINETFIVPAECNSTGAALLIVVEEEAANVAAGESRTRSVNIRFVKNSTLWVSTTGDDGTGEKGRYDLPYETWAAAQSDAESGDTILGYPGDYSAETDLAGKDGVTYVGMDGATLPAFNVTTAITIKGSGLCQSLICNNAGAVVDMPEMDTVTYIGCGGGTQIAGNAGTFIQCAGGTQIAGNAGTFIQCDGGTQTAGNAGTYIRCDGGTLTIRNADQSHDGTTRAPIALSGSASLTIENSRHESTEENGTVIALANNWSGSLDIGASCRFKAANVGTDGATTGIQYGTDVTGTVDIGTGCIIETAEDGTGTAKSIDAPSAQTVTLDGDSTATHAADGDITIAGGTLIIDPDAKA